MKILFVILALCSSTVLAKDIGPLPLPGPATGDEKKLPKTCQKGIKEKEINFSCDSKTRCMIPTISKGALHISAVDELPNGFGLYRYAKPGNDKETDELCQAGIERVLVFDGTGEKIEKNHWCRKFDETTGRVKEWQIEVNTITEDDQKVPISEIAGKPDSVSRELSPEFIQKIDKWYAKAREDGVKVGVRCYQGLHRTGRAIAYYEMKYGTASLPEHRPATPEEATCHMSIFLDEIGHLKLKGKFLGVIPKNFFTSIFHISTHVRDQFLIPQVQNLGSQINASRMNR
jgi:hypothetical protein